MTPRPHAEIIRAWAEGHDVQYRRPGSNEWVDSPDPAFVSDYDYRVKPVRVFPETLLSDGEITRKWKELRNDHMLNYEEERRELINYGIKHAIDNGQVVTREEFAKVSEEAQCATKSLIAAGYTYRGGELWEPPIGKAHENHMARDMTVAMTVAKRIRHKCYTASQQAIGTLDLESLIAAAIS